MSNIPFLAPTVRKGKKLGHTELLDGMVHDALWDSFHNLHMGECAEMVAQRMGISREEQDDHAVKTVEKAQRAAAAGFTKWEMIAVDTTTTDQALSKMKPDKLRGLKPAFSKERAGTITAGNASPITDGAAAVVLASQQGLDHLNTSSSSTIKPIARIVSFADAAQDPREFATSPTLAINKALDIAGLSVGDIDYWEINEAFSVVDIANQRLLHLDDARRVNVFGGSVALGHPVGASGCRIVVTLLNVLRVTGGMLGCAAICNGGGGATAIIIENMMMDEKSSKL